MGGDIAFKKNSTGHQKLLRICKILEFLRHAADVFFFFVDFLAKPVGSLLQTLRDSVT